MAEISPPGPPAHGAARWVRLLIAGLLVWLAAPPASPASAQETFTLELEDRRVEVPLRRIAGTMYVALGDLARAFGGRVEWLEPGERAAGIFLEERMIFRRDVPYVEAGGSLHQIPHAPRFSGGELYLPFSFIQQGLPAIFPERFDFQPETSSLRKGPPGGVLEDIEYLVAPGLTTLRFFFAGSPTLRLAADNSLPHALVLRVEGPPPGALALPALRGLGMIDSVLVESDSQGGERLLFFLADDAFLYQVGRLQQPAGFEVTLFSPAAGVDAEAVLARGAPRAPAGLPPAPRRRSAAAPPVEGEDSGARSPSARAEGIGSGPAGSEATATSAPAGEPPVVETPLAEGPPEPRKRTGIQTIVIDPGHGGRDAGAVGPSGVLEKDVALQVARALREELEERVGLRVILTRDRDVFVPLTARTRMANQAGADLFLSIHCNSARARAGAGFETYFLSEAKTEDERRVARMENSALRFENPSVDPEQLGELNFILWDLAQNEYLRESSFLAELVQGGLADELDLRNRGVKQAGFWVLNGAYMPAILVETAFISNPREERLLASRDFQARLVDGIADSILEYVDLYERKVTTPEVGA